MPGAPKYHAHTTAKYACMMDGLHIWLTCAPSTMMIQAPALMSLRLAVSFCDAGAAGGGEGPGGKQTSCSCACVSLVALCIAWLNLNGLESGGTVTAVITRPALEHCVFEDISGFAMNTQAWCPNNLCFRMM